ncbi:MAG: hypothetical protein CMF48_04760 [Legionellales bacterium]|nr:hypothetical protein [Legionellales bacterium]
MAEIIQLPEYADERGALTVLEKKLPFEIKRTYWIYNLSKGSQRGGHRHLKTQQAMVCLNGQSRVRIINRNEDKVILLNKPTNVLLLEPEDWHTMYDFTSDTVLLLLASHFYDKNDYVLEPLECKFATKI